jgi:gliding motility-associated lipoprotein GldH
MLLAAALLSLVACRQDSIYTRQFHLADALWTSGDTLRFETAVDDTNGLYDLVIALRNTTDYPYSNIYFFIHTHFPQGQVSVDTLQYLLADPYGQWLGSGRGFLRDHSILYRYNIRFSQAGLYRFNIVHAMRNDTLTGIDELGFTLRHAKYPQKDGREK